MKELFGLPADEAVARVCRLYLKAARRALPRVHDPKDDEGLHDFRVALRRMRSYLRIYRDDLQDAIPEKHYQQLKKLAARTNEARDVEVMLAWLDSELPQLGARQQEGAQWWRQRLVEQYGEAYARLGDDLDVAFNTLATALEESLKALVTKPAGKRSFAAASAFHLRQLTRDLEQELGAIHTLDDMNLIHETRITGKKVRYLLEPLGKSMLVCNHAVMTMRLFQDLFGNLNDCFVRQAAMHDIIAVAAAEWGEQQLQQTLINARVTLKGSEVMPGLLAIARRNHSVSNTYFRQIERDYLRGGGERLVKQLNGVVERLKN
jgi:CHAD domain-containing protein